MDAEFKENQIGTRVVWVGALEGGLGAGWSLRGVHPKKYTCLSKTKTDASINTYVFWYKYRKGSQEKGAFLCKSASHTSPACMDWSSSACRERSFVSELKFSL